MSHVIRSITAHNCHCPCGAVVFAATREPLARLYCHCSICQRFNNSDMADIVVYRRDSVLEPAARLIEFRTWRAPPNVQRGRCVNCSAPSIEVFDPPLLPGLIMVPRAMFAHGTALPAPAAHLFYEERQNDHDDELPKHRGYVGSQLAFARHVIPGLFGRH